MSSKNGIQCVCGRFSNIMISNRCPGCSPGVICGVLTRPLHKAKPKSWQRGRPLRRPADQAESQDVAR